MIRISATMVSATSPCGSTPWSNDRGMALVEFAIALPVLLLLYLGGFQLFDAMACNRRVTVTARAVVDLTSQYSSLSSAQTAAILSASQQTMTPYSAANAIVTVTEVHTDQNGQTTIVWDQANRGTPPAWGLPYAIPPAIAVPNAYLLVGEVSYSYIPPIIYGIVGPLTLHDRIYMSPRLSNAVSYAS